MTTTALHHPFTAHPRTARRLRRAARRTALPEHWPVVAVFACYPLLWALGLGLALPLLGLPLLVRLSTRRSVRVPPGFGLWLFFLGWAALSASQLEELSNYLAFTYRFLLWASAVVVLVYVYDTPRDRLPDETLLHAMLVLWALSIVGGWLAIAFGDLRLATPVSLVTPGAVRSIPFLWDTISPKLAQVQVFLGYPISRPAAPFTYTNAWGANLAVLVPVVAAVWPMLEGRRRAWVGGLLLASVVPIVVSANRGLWVTLIATTVYVAVRAAHRQDPRMARRLALGGAALVVAVLVTPLGGLVSDRLETDHSGETRMNIYERAQEETAKSPLLGYGSPRTDPENPDAPPVGTHGTLWMVLYSHGVPGVVAFVGGLAGLALRTRNPRNRRYLWLHAAVVGGLFMIPFYELIPMPIFTVAACAGIVLRELAEPEPAPREPAVRSRRRFATT